MKSIVALSKPTCDPTLKPEGWEGRRLSSPPPSEASATALADGHHRSVAKAVSWRAVGTIDTFVVSFLVTGRLKLAISIGFVEFFTKLALFYVHERVWNKIPFGRVASKVDYEI